MPMLCPVLHLLWLPYNTFVVVVLISSCLWLLHVHVVSTPTSAVAALHSSLFYMLAGQLLITSDKCCLP